MSSEDFTRAVTVKRNTKKKSGYTVTEEDGEFFIGAVPDKARVSVGDKIAGINGIRAEDFEDEEDANTLIDSIRLVFVPADEIEEYEAAKAAEENGQALAGVATTKNEKRVRSLIAGGGLIQFLSISPKFVAHLSEHTLPTL